MLRISGLFTLALCFCFLGTTLAQEKKDPKIDGSKIVGAWEIVKDENIPPGTPVEFAKDGGIILKIAANGKEIKLEGTYKIAGDKLTVTMKKPDGKDDVEVDTIKTLTDDRLVVTGPKGKDTEFKKKTGK